MSVLNAPPREGLIRAVRADMQLRAAGDGEPARLAGHFSVFNTWTEINSPYEGRFLERIAPGAFRKTFRDNGSNIKLLLEHGQDPTVGQKPLGRFTLLEEDEIGARYEADLYDTPYVNDLLPALRDGMYGASFRFRVVREDINNDAEASDYNPNGLPERTIREASVAEAGPVLWGAYPEATSQARSMTDEFMFRRFMDLPKDRLEALADFWRERDNTEPEPEPEEVRSIDDAGLLAQALTLIGQYVEDDTDETIDMAAIKSIAQQLSDLIAAEVAEPETEMNSSAPDPEDESRRARAEKATPPTRAPRRRNAPYHLSNKETSWKIP